MEEVEELGVKSENGEEKVVVAAEHNYLAR